MSKKQNAAGAAAAFHQETNNSTLSNCTSIDSRLQNEIDNLIDQASGRMSHDPANWGRHSAIWLSLVFARNRWPWPPPGVINEYH